MKEFLQKPIFITIISVVLAASGGGAAGTYIDSASDVKVQAKFEELQHSIQDLKNEKVDKKSIEAILQILIVINYDICILRADNNQSERATCKRERNRKLTEID